jgi:hypothetical protein
MHLVVLDVELVLAVHVAHAGAKATDSAPAHTRKPQTHALARHVDGELNARAHQSPRVWHCRIHRRALCVLATPFPRPHRS